MIPLRHRQTLRSPRLARRRRGEKRRKALVWSFGALAFSAGVAYLLSLPSFAIRRISVTGESAISSSAIVSVIDRELAGSYLGFIPKANIFLYPKARVAESLRAEFPSLASVSVAGNLAALSVAVSDRKPAALWCSGGSCRFMDAGGFLFGAAAGRTEGLFYRFEDGEHATASPRVGIQALSEERVRGLFALLRQLEVSGMEAISVEIKQHGEIIVLLRDGVRLLMVDDGDFSPELARLAALLSEEGIVPRDSASRLRVDYIDLRYGNKIYFKPR